MRQKHGGTQHHKWRVLVSALSSASAAATSAAFSPLHVVLVVDMAGDSPIIVPALKLLTGLLSFTHPRGLDARLPEQVAAAASTC